MQPFFKSENNDIIPFSEVAILVMAKNSARKAGILTKSSNEEFVFYFDTIIDRETQLKNYENYLINQYKLQELL